MLTHSSPTGRSAQIWRTCGHCGIGYSAVLDDGPPSSLSHCHRPDGGMEWVVWTKGTGAEYLPILPLPPHARIQGTPVGGWPEVELVNGVTVTQPWGEEAVHNGEITRYRLWRHGAKYVLSLSGSRHWAVWTAVAGVAVSTALTRYCRTPLAAIDALVDSLASAEDDEALTTSIEDLTDRLADAILSYRQHGLERTRAALAGGEALVELRRVLRHGDFGPHVERMRMNERTARRWMQLAQLGITAEEVQERGGIRAAIKALAPLSTSSLEDLGDVLTRIRDNEGAADTATAAPPPEAPPEPKPPVPAPGPEGPTAEEMSAWTDEEWVEYKATGVLPQDAAAEAKTDTVTGLPYGWQVEDGLPPAKPDPDPPPVTDGMYVPTSAPESPPTIPPPTAPSPNTVSGFLGDAPQHIPQCVRCGGTPRRGSLWCRPCARERIPEGTEASRLLRDVARLQKRVSSLTWIIGRYRSASGLSVQDLVSYTPPVRIQRRREAGWRKPDGTVDCTRQSALGNPHDTAREYRELVIPTLTDQDLAAARRAQHLMCWCPPDAECHVDEIIAELVRRYSV